MYSRKPEVRRGFVYSQIRVAGAPAALKEVRDLHSFKAIGSEFHIQVV